MSNSDQGTQDSPAEQVSNLRRALVESPNDTVAFDGRNDTVGNSEKSENRQIMWWAFVLPVLVLVIIIAVHILNAPATTGAEDERSWQDDPASSEEPASSTESPDKSPNEAFVSSIAYNKSHALAFINGQMVPEGAVVDGVTVFKIHQDTVEFEKNGKRWIQRVGE
ncbi:MAG: hypothetical protein ACYSWQ_18015 [Planctomycetota bacterium]|jgi:hypothetical protein